MSRASSARAAMSAATVVPMLAPGVRGGEAFSHRDDAHATERGGAKVVTELDCTTIMMPIPTRIEMSSFGDGGAGVGAQVHGGATSPAG
jgi:hypothetical protein